MTEYIIKLGEADRSMFREEVVRCRDCDKLNIVGECPCGFWALEDMKLDGFCAWGERRDNGNP